MLLLFRGGFNPYRHTSANRKKRTSEDAPFLLVEMMGIEPMSENLLTQPSSWTVCCLEFPLGSANRHAFPQGSPFVHDRLKCEPPMHVHRSNDAQSEVAVLLGGTGDPQVTALPVLRPEGVKLRQP